MLNGHNITPSHAATHKLKRYAVLIGLELEHYIVSIEFGKLHGHLDYDMVNCALDIAGTKAQFGKTLEKGFQTENWSK